LSGSAGPDSFTWFYFKDHATPAIDSNGDNVFDGGIIDGTAFQNGEDYITIRKVDGIHVLQDPTNPNSYNTPDSNPAYLFFEADFGSAAAQTSYTTQITVDFFTL
jgi:hypothetical protein